MEKKGIKTEKGEFNRWIRRTNAFIRNLRKNLSALLETIKEIKAELDKPRSEAVIIPLQRYFDMRNAKAYSQKAKVSNLKALNEMVNYLKASKIYTIEDLESRVSALNPNVVPARESHPRRCFAHIVAKSYPHSDGHSILKSASVSWEAAPCQIFCENKKAESIRNQREHSPRFKVMFYVIGSKNSKSGSAFYSSRQQNQRRGGAVRHFLEHRIRVGQT